MSLSRAAAESERVFKQETNFSCSPSHLCLTGLLDTHPKSQRVSVSVGSVLWSRSGQSSVGVEGVEALPGVASRVFFAFIPKYLRRFPLKTQ